MTHLQDHPATLTHCKLLPDTFTLIIMSQPRITLTPSEFWTYVKADADCDEVLELLDNRYDLVSHFLYFSSLARTLDDLDELMKKKKKEIKHVFTELTRLPDFRNRTDAFVRRKHRLHPYRRPPTPVQSPQSSSTANNHTASSPRTVPILSLPPSPILLGDSPSTPIDVDSLSSSSYISSYVTAPTNPPTRPATPIPPFGTAHRSYRDEVRYFMENGIYYVQCEISGHVYEEREYYRLPRSPYRHHLPQLRLPSIPRSPRRM